MQCDVLSCFLTSKLYHSLSVCSSLHDKMGFDSLAPSVCCTGSSRRSKGPGVWQHQHCRAQGAKHQPTLLDVIRAFPPSNIGQTFPRPWHADKYNAQGCMHCQEGTKAFHCTSHVAPIHFNHTRQGQGTQALLCCYLCSSFSGNGDFL